MLWLIFIGPKTLLSVLFTAIGSLIKLVSYNFGRLWQHFDLLPTYSVHQVAPESSYKPGFMSKIKRSCSLPPSFNNFITRVRTTCSCLVPHCLKSTTSTSTIKISWVTVIQVILVPLGLIAADVGSDGDVLQQMWPGTNLAGKEDGQLLGTLFVSSAFVLFCSICNLLGSNPVKSLLRSARTSTLMKSRRAESENIALPIGDYQISKLYHAIFHVPSINQNLIA